MTNFSSKRGFTILETVIYIALFSILMTGILVTVYELLAGGAQNRESVAIQEEGTFINRKISWALGGATAITVPNTKTLVITRPDLGGQSPLTISESGGHMLISRGSVAGTPLTTAEFTVGDVNISLIPATASGPMGVSIEYTIESVPFVFKSYLRY